MERSPNVPTAMAAIFAEEKSEVFGGGDGVGDEVMLEVEVVLVEDELCCDRGGLLPPIM